jgi:acetyltransferase
MITVQLLGGACLRSNDALLGGPPAQRHRIALLTLIVAAWPQPVSRDRAMALLWPERDLAGARRLLNLAVHVLRSALGEDAIASVGDGLLLNQSHLSCDLHELRDAIAEGACERVARLYTGPLLEGFFLGESREFGYWLDQRRSELTHAYTGALLALAERQERSGDVHGRVGTCLRLVAADPHSGVYAQALMRALDAAGDRAGAIHHASEHGYRLRADLDLEPDPDVGALAEELRGAPPRRRPALTETVALTVRVIASTEIEDLLPALVGLLRESVDGGASLGFLPPLTDGEARHYWLSLGPELRGGLRLLFAATVADRLVGSGQLALPSWTNGRHRAEVQKVMVAAAHRGWGIGRRLMQIMHDTARERGRSLLLLNTRRGGPAERFYRGLGYRDAGMIPGYSVGPEGESYDNLLLYQCLRAEEEWVRGGRTPEPRRLPAGSLERFAGCWIRPRTLRIGDIGSDRLRSLYRHLLREGDGPAVVVCDRERHEIGACGGVSMPCVLGLRPGAVTEIPMVGDHITVDAAAGGAERAHEEGTGRGKRDGRRDVRWAIGVRATGGGQPNDAEGQRESVG